MAAGLREVCDRPCHTPRLRDYVTHQCRPLTTATSTRPREKAMTITPAHQAAELEDLA
jgi:hypothetical protein